MGDVGHNSDNVRLRGTLNTKYVQVLTPYISWRLNTDSIDSALDLTPPLPAELEVLHQWVAEPTRFLFLPASAFITNMKGYPVLPKGTQSFIRDIMKVSPRMYTHNEDVKA